MENQEPVLEHVDSVIENPEVPDAIQFGHQNIRFLKFAGIRPRNISAEFPSYSPDRDYVQLTRIVNNMIDMLRTTQLEWWKPIMVKLGIEFEVAVDSGRQLSPSLDESVKAIVSFVDAAYGKLSEEKYIDDPRHYKSYEAAVAELFRCNKEGLLVVLAMLGSDLLDMLFFGARQDRLIGREGKFTMGELIQTLPAYSGAIRDGADPEERASEYLQQATKAALLAGLTGSQISLIVDQAVVDASK